MDLNNKNQPGMRKKRIFSAVCDYLRSFNPYPDRNFNDAYVDFVQKKLNNSSFDTTRLSKWIQGSRSDLLKNPVHIDILIQFIIDTFANQNISPETIATQIRAEYQKNDDAFYDFVKRHEKLYFHKEYIPYLTNLIRDETNEYNKEINPETPSKKVLAPYLMSKPSLLYSILGISCIILIGIICYIMFISPKVGVKPTSTTPPVINPNDEQDISLPKKINHLEQLPKDGQLIIPKGYYFKITTNMCGNARQFSKEDTIETIVKFSMAVAKDRANRLDKKTQDFPTIIWNNSNERYQKDILHLKEYPEDNTIINIIKPLILYSNEHIIMFEYSIVE